MVSHQASFRLPCRRSAPQLRRSRIRGSASCCQFRGSRELRRWTRQLRRKATGALNASSTDRVAPAATQIGTRSAGRRSRRYAHGHSSRAAMKKWRYHCRRGTSDVGIKVYRGRHATHVEFRVQHPQLWRLIIEWGSKTLGLPCTAARSTGLPCTAAWSPREGLIR